MEAAEYSTYPYHVMIPSFGEWGFVLAGRAPVDATGLSVPVATRFLDGAAFRDMGNFPRDMERTPDIVVNRMDRPTLARVYRDSWGAW